MTEYLDYKRAKGKRSISQDEQIGEKLKRGFGVEASVTEITAQRIAQYDRDRVTQTSRLGRPVTPSTVNRELAIRSPRSGAISRRCPKIRHSKEPEGRHQRGDPRADLSTTLTSPAASCCSSRPRAGAGARSR